MPKYPQFNTIKKMSNKKFPTKRRKIEVAPDFIKTLSNGAGYDANSSIDELIDNSIGANANIINIHIENGHFKIEDIGEDAGMDEVTLLHNFFCAGKSSTRKNKNAPGKFGIGGKTAILAIIGETMDTDVKIVTHKKGASPFFANWEVKQYRVNEYELTLLQDYNIPYGTTIEFDYNREIDVIELINHISIVYCWEIWGGLEISVNGIHVTPSDPLYRYNNNVINNKLFKEKKIKVGGDYIIIRSTAFNSGNIIPEEELHSWDKGKGKTKSVCTANRSGIYVLTGNRYYTLGNNFDSIMSGTAHASLDGLRIEVVIPKSLWDKIGMTWNKGKEIISFTKIMEFCENGGVTDYIHSLMLEFKNDKKTTDDKTVANIKKIIEEIIKNYDIDIVKISPFASNCKNGRFVEYGDNILKFDISNTNMGQKEILGSIKAISVFVNTLIKNGNEQLVFETVEKFNI